MGKKHKTHSSSYHTIGYKKKFLIKNWFRLTFWWNFTNSQKIFNPSGGILGDKILKFFLQIWNQHCINFLKNHLQTFAKFWGSDDFGLMHSAQVWYIVGIVSSSPTHFHSEKIGLIGVTIDPQSVLALILHSEGTYSEVWNITGIVCSSPTHFCT